jgi:hypothetical protein
MPAHEWWEVAKNEYNDLSDAYADSRNFTIEFQGVIPGTEPGHIAAFKPYLTNYSDNWSSDWAGEQVFGRTDPIYTWRSTGRSISLGFKTVAASYGEAVSNMCNIQKLIKLQYPFYMSDSPELATTISKGPLVRIKFANLIMGNAHDTHSVMEGGDQLPADWYRRPDSFDTPANPKGLLGVIKSLSCSPDLEEGMVEGFGTAALYPKVWNVSLEFGVLHENILGWTSTGSDVPGASVTWIGQWDGATRQQALDNQQSGMLSTKESSMYPYGIDQGCSGRHGMGNVDEFGDPCPTGDCGNPNLDGGPPRNGENRERPCDRQTEDCPFDDNDEDMIFINQLDDGDDGGGGRILNNCPSGRYTSDPPGYCCDDPNLPDYYYGCGEDETGLTEEEASRRTNGTPSTAEDDEVFYRVERGEGDPDVDCSNPATPCAILEPDDEDTPAGQGVTRQSEAQTDCSDPNVNCQIVIEQLEQSTSNIGEDIYDAGMDAVYGVFDVLREEAERREQVQDYYNSVYGEGAHLRSPDTY